MVSSAGGPLGGSRAMGLARPVKLVRTRREDFLTTTQGRGQVNDVEAAVAHDGPVLALRCRTLSHLGAYLETLAPYAGMLTGRLLTGPYRIPAAHYELTTVFANTMSTAPYRGAGRPEAAYICERTMDEVARQCGLDPADVRRRNLIRADEFPYKTPSGFVYDSGQYEAALDRVLTLVDYKSFRELQRARRVEHRWLGIGFSSFVDRGRFGVRGVPGRTVSLADVAAAAWASTGLPPDMEPGLDATTVWEPTNFTFPSGTHAAIVEVDPESGAIRLVRLVAVDDCGRVINPLLVEGQIHGGLAQGIGQALWEHLAYDDSGQCVTASLMDYAIAKAALLPTFELDSIETPSPVNVLGAKGSGESGTIGSTPAIVNAVIDALAPFGVAHLDMPLTPASIWAAVEHARRTR